jgi:hypothetical protein
MRFSASAQSKNASPAARSSASPAAPSRRCSTLVCHIYGGSNVIAANAATIQQAGRDLITAGDTAGLIKALWNFGVTDDDAKKIIHSLAEDSGSQASPSLGQKTIGVIKTVAGKVASAGKNISVSVATSVITQMVLQYLGSGPIPT